MAFLHDELVDVKFEKDWKLFTYDLYYQLLYKSLDNAPNADDEEVARKYTTIFNQLKKYEDTGLSPNDIKNLLKAFYILKERGEALEKQGLYLKACLGISKPKITLRRI